MEASNSTIEHASIKINRANALSKDDFAEMIQETKISLYRISKSILKNEADVEDAISETILKAYVNLDRLKDQNSFKSWIMKILVNECYSIGRKYKRLDLTDDMEVFEGTYEDKADNSLISYVNSLKPEYRAVVILFYYEDLSIADISSVLKISNGTVKSRLFRAKSKLKTIIKSDSFFEEE